MWVVVFVDVVVLVVPSPKFQLYDDVVFRNRKLLLKVKVVGCFAVTVRGVVVIVCAEANPMQKQTRTNAKTIWGIFVFISVASF